MKRKLVMSMTHLCRALYPGCGGMAEFISGRETGTASDAVTVLQTGRITGKTK